MPTTYYPTGKKVYHNHAFTHRDSGGTLGIAQQGVDLAILPNNVGGVCEMYIAGAGSVEVPFAALNTAFTTTSATGYECGDVHFILL